MALSFKRVHPGCVAEVGPIELREVRERAALEEILAGMGRHGMPAFRNQPFTDAGQLDFAQAFDGTLHARNSAPLLVKNRFGNEALSGISSAGAYRSLLSRDDRRRMTGLAA